MLNETSISGQFFWSSQRYRTRSDTVETIAGGLHEGSADGIGEAAEFDDLGKFFDLLLGGITVNADGASATLIDGTRIRTVHLRADGQAEVVSLAGKFQEEFTGEESDDELRDRDVCDAAGGGASRFEGLCGIAAWPDGSGCAVFEQYCGVRVVSSTSGETRSLSDPHHPTKLGGSGVAVLPGAGPRRLVVGDKGCLRVVSQDGAVSMLASV